MSKESVVVVNGASNLFIKGDAKSVLRALYAPQVTPGWAQLSSVTGRPVLVRIASVTAIEELNR